MNYYEVSPTKIVRAGSDTLTYASNEEVPIGALVQIPVGKKTLVGVVLQKVAKPTYNTKEISARIEETSLPQQLLATAVWMSSYYATPLATVWQTLLPAGLTTQRRDRIKDTKPSIRERTHFLLNNDQQRAIKTIDKSTGTHLLHGVTGSGKTAVYIELARRCIERNESVIILVPEIALTSQLVDEFTQHFSGKIILTHSQQTSAQRHLAWRECLLADTPKIVLGPRSALFMPLQDVGLIVLDEAHEPSYKQDKSPRYNTLRVASTLAAEHAAPLVLGSATPSIVDYYMAKQQDKIIHLPTPAKKPTPPDLTIIDTTKRSEFKRHRFLSEQLLTAVEETLATGHQALVFHNRRGSASVSLCESCGWQAGCPTCLLPLTLHADHHNLRCHACGYTAVVPTSCPQCSGTDILHRGIGTKLIESELRKIFTKATIARFDADTDKTASLDSRYGEVYRGDIDIIIGTQVIAKGLDLPHLRLVGVPQADAGLHLPDYTSAERTFQLLSQVVGRVGRYEHPTRVVMQSYHPTHPVITAGIAQDYANFYTHTLSLRQRGLFPPYSFLLQVTTTYKTEAAAIQNIKKLAFALKQSMPSLTVGQPTPAFYERAPGGYRWQLLIKSSRRADLQQALAYIPAGPHWQYDLDPQSLL